MKSFYTVFAAAAVLLQPAAAHYRFTSLILNGQVTTAYQYVRQNSNMNSPVSTSSIDVRCNTGASLGGSTQTATVAAGATVGFKMDQPIYHAGPLLVYISKAPSTAATYDGSGAWAKIYQIAPTFNGNGPVWGDEKDTFTFTLPSSLAAGEYLLRIEQVALHSMPAQHYVSCAQLKVTGGGGKTPTGIALPGGYDPNSSSFNINIYYPIMTSYTMPGGSIWS
ncbi:glycoside hydrolase [Pyronema domesticum]|uniref:lytic cellulose monooxygenase (C4-dehydrogenating) n=1 Tax=Pyronema omphalodes (strain CBS 100304) TaxID=1076935 RepID=U4LHA4_PYROM|nr:glycoside hydrolase [Pyronema domesticum]CCX30902.1 Similar to Cellulose-growth-specific protein; acc. no. Q00023 [Pyronema omphalodes CBS 100304]